MDGPSEEELQAMMHEKACELFALCDIEKKGFIGKRDMQRLQAQLPLSPDQLESVFDSLDEDHNGFLTLDEFTSGFGAFLGMSGPPDEPEPKTESVYGPGLGDDGADAVEGSEETDQAFSELVSDLQGQNIYEEVDVLKSLWMRLRSEEDPSLLDNFEGFVKRVTGEIRRTQGDLNQMEGALKSKSMSHDKELQKLYDEMENQIKLEKERISQEILTREKNKREELEKLISEKDKFLQDVLKRQQDLESKLENVASVDVETKFENEQLLKERNELEYLLDEAQRNFSESQSYIGTLKNKQINEKKERALAAIRITEGIAKEKESLVKQLDMLRDMNKKMRDEKDFMSGGRSPVGGLSHRAELLEAVDGDGSTSPTSPVETTADKRKNLHKQGSILSNYFSSSTIAPPPGWDEEDAEFDDYTIPTLTNEAAVPLRITPGNRNAGFRGSFSGLSFDDDTPTSPRGEPVGETSPSQTDEQPQIPNVPQRLFKIVFVGDSGVGKSSFIHRFTKDFFKGTFCATIGVDFQVKNILVDKHLIALQLWDTAGQERFRSITKQYFRKADGVLIMYDLVNENSFTSVRNWMHSVQEGAEEGTVFAIVGNKIDLVKENEELRQVSYKDGSRLADEFGALFHEASGKSGDEVNETLEEMASLLCEREDCQIEKSLILHDDEFKKKTGCCS